MVQREFSRGEIAPAHHVARYCRGRDIRNDGTVSPVAFELRPGEAYLSTNWLEYFHENDRQAQISSVRQALTGKGFRVRANGAFAILNVGGATSTVRKTRNLAISFISLGESHDPSHTGIFGYTTDDTDTAATLAHLAGEVYSALA